MRLIAVAGGSEYLDVSTSSALRKLPGVVTDDSSGRV